MQFQIVRDAIINKLGEGAALLPADNQFRVVGYQRQAIDAKCALMSSVQIYYNSGDLPKNSSGFVDNVRHNINMRLDFTVAGKAKGNLQALENAITPAGKMAALATFQEASADVDLRIDQLWSDVWNILMDAENETYGLPVGALSSRWVGGFTKNDVSDKGEIVVISGSTTLTCSVTENVLGVIGTLSESIDVTLSDINGDVNQKTGAVVSTTGN